MKGAVGVLCRSICATGVILLDNSGTQAGSVCSLMIPTFRRVSLLEQLTLDQVPDIRVVLCDMSEPSKRHVVRVKHTQFVILLE